ncbi:MAG: hypothetical protein ACR2M3_21615 [Thermomicrobiales bacterium]
MHSHKIVKNWRVATTMADAHYGADCPLFVRRIGVAGVARHLVTVTV